MTASVDPYRLRTLTSLDEIDEVARLLWAAFGEDTTPEEIEHERLVFEPGRDHVIEHEGEPVANAGAYTREVTVPGAIVAGTHVSLVGVLPTHRRRGLLSRLMAHQLREAHEVYAEPVALLWASEGRIYQRYGYGLASEHLALRINRREVGLRRPTSPELGRLRDAAPEQVIKDMQQVYERVRPVRPGWSSRHENWWNWRVYDPPGRRQGHSARRALLYEGASGVEGYALWRTKQQWEDQGPNGEVNVGEVVAATPEAYLALWRFLLSVDLTRSVRYWYGAVDEPLRYLVDEPRALNLWVGDGLWLRIVDVAAALSARRYACAVDVVLAVTDALLPHNAGHWRLTGGPDGAGCSRTTDDPDLACDIADLGSVYLGGGSLAALAAAGRVRELRPGALAQASTAFGWHLAPSALETF